MKSNEVYGVTTIKTTPNEVYGVTTGSINTTPNEVYGVMQAHQGFSDDITDDHSSDGLRGPLYPQHIYEDVKL